MGLLMSPTAARYTFEQKILYTYKFSGLHKGSMEAFMHNNDC